MPCTAGRTPAMACGEPDNGLAYTQDCGHGHVDEVRLCAFHALRSLEPGESPVYCMACWRDGWVLAPVTITVREGGGA